MGNGPYMAFLFQDIPKNNSFKNVLTNFIFTNFIYGLDQQRDSSVTGTDQLFT